MLAELQSRPIAHTQISAPPAWDAFLAELTLLSERHGVGLAGEPVVYAMEPDDKGYAYHADDNGRVVWR